MSSSGNQYDRTSSGLLMTISFHSVSVAATSIGHDASLRSRSASPKRMIFVLNAIKPFPSGTFGPLAGNLSDPRTGEVRRIRILGTWVNKDGAGRATAP